MLYLAFDLNKVDKAWSMSFEAGLELERSKRSDREQFKTYFVKVYANFIDGKFLRFRRAIRV